MKTLVDSFAWLEYFRGTDRGKRVLDHLRKHEIHVSVLNLYEVAYRVEEEAGEGRAREFLRSLEAHATVHPVGREEALAAARIKRERKQMGAVDCHVLATARLHGLKVLTGDPHFEGLKEVIPI
ncbi:MAG: PIN domain-containing protein [Euryarchaeota archaeon]|nr:PIN domain-containing protein [Euryarchaeota archaeon]